MIIMNKKELPKCSVEMTLSLISNKWKILIIRDLLDGTKRFGELRKSINGISNKVLTYNLREMEEDNLLVRKIYPEVPPNTGKYGQMGCKLPRKNKIRITEIVSN